MATKREQKLIDLCFEIALMLSTPGTDRDNKPYDLTKLSHEEKGEWITRQLKLSGFPTHPVGMSWGVLDK